MPLNPLSADEWNEEVRNSLAGLIPAERNNPRDASNAISTLVRHPNLAHVFLQFSNYLLFESTLPPRLRELAILRVAHHHACAYEWVQHTMIAKHIGLSESEIASIQNGGPADEFDRIVLTAVDDVHATSRISDETWRQLGSRLDDRQRMDLVFTIGGYGTLAVALNTFGVEPEDFELSEEELGAAFQDTAAGSSD